MGQKGRLASAQAARRRPSPKTHQVHNTDAVGRPLVVAFGPNKALDAVAKYKDVSLTAWSMFRRYFSLIHLCPRILKPDVPDVLWIRAACPFDPVLYFHCILIRAAQEGIVRAAGRFPARMLMVVRPFERVQKFPSIPGG
jgi:hypothetical protein